MRTHRDPDELSAAFKEAISRFTTGVSIISTSVDGRQTGMTASAVASLSLDPLQLLVCIRSDLPTRHAIEEAGAFAVNVLAEDQDYLALHFARRQEDKFAGLTVREGYSVPVLETSMAFFVCRVAEAVPGGDHTIFIGDVIDCGHSEAVEPLVYFSRRFNGICTPDAHVKAEYARYLDFSM